MNREKASSGLRSNEASPTNELKTPAKKSNLWRLRAQIHVPKSATALHMNQSAASKGIAPVKKDPMIEGCLCHLSCATAM
jgi:hypothetical protein